MIIFLKRLKRRITRFLLIRKALKQISNIQTNNNLKLKILLETLTEFFHNEISFEEKIWIDKIESLREQLNSSTEEITIIDFGVNKSKINDTGNIDGKSILDTIGNISSAGSKTYFWAFLLFKLIRKFKPKTCLELGTLVGISAAYQAAALMVNSQGRITTLEGAESLASLAKRNFEKLQLNNIEVVPGKFQSTLLNVASNLNKIDYAFIDGHHDEKATINYFNMLLPYLTDEAVIVFDDIHWTEGMKRAWEKIISNEKIKISVDLTQVGVCILNNSDIEKIRLKMSMI